MELKICDIVYCAFPTQEGGTLPHYGLVVGLFKAISNEVYAQIVYSSSQKVDPTQNSNPSSTDFVLTEKNFGEDFWKSSGMKKPCRFDFSISKRIPVRKVAGSVVGHLEINKNPKAFNAMRKAMLMAQ